MAERRRPTRSARGGKGGAEPTAVVLEREARVIRLSIDGHSQYEIAQALEITQAAVSKILARVTARWRAENTEQLHRAKMLQLHRYDQLYREAMAGWERSQQPRTRKRQRQLHDAAGEARGSDAEFVSEASAGDPRFLDVARRALADSAKLLGELPAGSGEGPHTFTLNLPELPTPPDVDTESAPSAGETGDDA